MDFLSEVAKVRWRNIDGLAGGWMDDFIWPHPTLEPRRFGERRRKRPGLVSDVFTVEKLGLFCFYRATLGSPYVELWILSDLPPSPPDDEPDDLVEAIKRMSLHRWTLAVKLNCQEGEIGAQEAPHPAGAN